MSVFLVIENEFDTLTPYNLNRLILIGFLSRNRAQVGERWKRR